MQELTTFKVGFGKLKEHSVPSAGKVISDLLQVLTIALVQLKGPHIIFLFLDCSLFSIQEKPHKQASVLPSVTPLSPQESLSLSPVAVTTEAAAAAGPGLQPLTWNALTHQHGNLPVHLI